MCFISLESSINHVFDSSSEAPQLKWLMLLTCALNTAPNCSITPSMPLSLLSLPCALSFRLNNNMPMHVNVVSINGKRREVKCAHRNTQRTVFDEHTVDGTWNVCFRLNSFIFYQLIGWLFIKLAFNETTKFITKVLVCWSQCFSSLDSLPVKASLSLYNLQNTRLYASCAPFC